MLRALTNGGTDQATCQLQPILSLGLKAAGKAKSSSGSSGATVHLLLCSTMDMKHALGDTQFNRLGESVNCNVECRPASTVPHIMHR